MNDKHSSKSGLFPTVSYYRPDRYFGSVPEKLTQSINNYVTKNRHLFSGDITANNR